MVRPISEPKTKLAKRFCAVREKLGFKERKQFAEYLGISANKLGTYETGAKEPTVSAIVPYKTVCNISLDWLITGEGEMFVKSAEARAVSEEDVDLDRLTAAIETVEKALCKTELKPGPEKKAELARIAYVMLKDEEDQNNILRLMETMLADR